jgi:hypothetical protein
MLLMMMMMIIIIIIIIITTTTVIGFEKVAQFRYLGDDNKSKPDSGGN